SDLTVQPQLTTSHPARSWGGTGGTSSDEAARRQSSRNFLNPDPKFDANLADLRRQGSAELARSPTLPAESVTLVADPPGAGADSRHVGEYFHRRQAAANERVLLENYTYIPTDVEDQIIEALIRRHVSVELLTNSSRSVGGWDAAWELSLPDQ